MIYPIEYTQLPVQQSYTAASILIHKTLVITYLRLTATLKKPQPRAMECFTSACHQDSGNQEVTDESKATGS